MKKTNSKRIIALFNSLNIADWDIIGNAKSGGQAEIIEVQNRKSRVIGVFRILKSKGVKDILRFKRELNILTNYNHQNIVKILDYSKDGSSYWYISQRGIPFNEFWVNNYKTKLNQPDLLLEEAISILTQLSDGLIYLHKEGIIHRDIKAKNIVIINNRPVLIDFGISYITGEEHFTAVDEAVANVYSPDPSLSFMELVPPWIDIFLLSQLLIWMVSKGTNKPHIQRPLDWRWVIYLNFSEANLLRVKALTGLCSNYYTAPKDAGEFKILLNTLLINNMKDKGARNSDKLEKAILAINKGNTSKLLNFAEARSLIEARLPYFTSICTELEIGLNSLIIEYSKNIIIEFGSSLRVADFVKDFHVRSEKGLEALYQMGFYICCGEPSNRIVYEFTYTILTKDAFIYSKDLLLFENKPVVFINFNINEKLQLAGKNKQYYLAPDASGKLKLYNSSGLQLIKEVSTNDIINMLADSITDASLWSIVY